MFWLTLLFVSFGLFVPLTGYAHVRCSERQRFCVPDLTTLVTLRLPPTLALQQLTSQRYFTVCLTTPRIRRLPVHGLEKGWAADCPLDQKHDFLTRRPDGLSYGAK
jgi:hypothetical protein